MTALKSYGVHTPDEFDRLTYLEAFLMVAQGDPDIISKIKKAREKRGKTLK
ncbi:MAG: hypothetical protein ACREGH_03865 [Minisyncoccia bacterium]